MRRIVARSLYHVMAFALLAGSLAVGEPAPEDKPKEPDDPKPPTHTVKKGPFKIEISLKGVFEARDMSEVAVLPKEWTSFKVLRAVEHGSRVKRGGLLVTFDTEEIDEKLTKLRREGREADLEIRQVEEKIRVLEASTRLDLAAAERSKRIADEDLARFLKVDRPMDKKSADFALKSAAEYLENQEEELRQLEKMYEADDLTEETEEIILKRQRNDVKRARFSLERAKMFHQWALAAELPRSEEKLKHSAREEALSLREDKATLPLDVKEKRLDLEKKKADRTEARKKLDKLLADRACMNVKAPIAGIVYYGRCASGTWTGAAASTSSLRRDGSVTAKEVFMTIVKPRPMLVRATVPEEQLHNLHSGLKGTVQPTGYPEMRVSAILDRPSAVPLGADGYEAKAALVLDESAEALMPGMTCTVKLTVYRKKDAITVPAAVVFADELKDQKHHVYVLTKKGKHKKRRVTLGRKTDKQVEILKGLSEGDEVLLERPKDKS